MSDALSEILQTPCDSSGEKKKGATIRHRLVVATVCGVVAIGSIAATVPFIAPGFRRVCLPYLPASKKQIEHVLHFIHESTSAIGTRNARLIDLGSGDGRIVMETAALNIPSVGVELNRWLVMWSSMSAVRRFGVFSASPPRPRFYRADLFRTDLRNYNYVILFGVESMMPAIADKLAAELTPGSYFVACRFPLPTTVAKPSQVIGSGIDCVWIYRASDLTRVSSQ